MSRDARAEALSLLAVAHDVLKGEVTPEVPASVRFEALMVANAIRTAIRQIAAGEPAAPAEAARLVREAGGEPGEDAERALCALIRAGAFDPGTPRHEALRQALLARVGERLAVSNPKAAPPAG